MKKSPYIDSLIDIEALVWK